MQQLTVNQLRYITPKPSLVIMSTITCLVLQSDKFLAGEPVEWSPKAILGIPLRLFRGKKMKEQIIAENPDAVLVKEEQ